MGSHRESLQRLNTALHDLCQPLTTLQCRLEMAGLIGTGQACREAVHEGMAECLRVGIAVRRMREIVRAASEEAARDEAALAQQSHLTPLNSVEPQSDSA